MSEENVEIVRAALQAFTERDVDALVECFALDAEVRLPRNTLEGGSYKGREGVERALRDAFETWEDILIDVQSIRAVGNQVVVLSRVTNVGRAETPTVEYESASVAILRNGKIVHMRPYASHRDALEAAGLSEE